MQWSQKREGPCSIDLDTDPFKLSPNIQYLMRPLGGLILREKEPSIKERKDSTRQDKITDSRTLLETSAVVCTNYG